MRKALFGQPQNSAWAVPAVVSFSEASVSASVSTLVGSSAMASRLSEIVVIPAPKSSYTDLTSSFVIFSPPSAIFVSRSAIICFMPSGSDIIEDRPPMSELTSVKVS